MNSKTLVSIIIPTYNRAFCIKNALESVLKQTYSNYEIIVIDGPSSDNTEETVKSLKDERITFIREEKARGAGAARNTGIKIAKGEYVAFQDSDNIWHPSKLEKQIKLLIDAPSEIGMVYTGYNKIQNGKETYYPQAFIKNKSGEIHDDLLRENFIGCQTVLIPRKCFDKVGIFDERLPTTEDWELFVRVSKNYKILCIDEPLVVSYIQNDSISADLGKMVIAFKMILEKHYSEFSQSKYLLSQYYFNKIGTLLCENDVHKEGRAYIIKAIRTYPFAIKYYLVLFISLLGNNIYRICRVSLKLFNK